MYDEKSLLDLIQNIYDAAQNPERWRGVADRLSDGLGGSSVTIVPFHLAAEQPEMMDMVKVRFDPELWDLMATHYSSRETNPLVRGIERLPTDQYLPWQVAVSPEEYLGSGVFNDVIKPLGNLHSGSITIPFDMEWVCILGVSRPKALDQLDEDEAAALNRLVPHIRTAMQIQRRFSMLQAERDAAADALDRLPLGVILLNKAGEVILANRAASEIVNQADGLEIRQRRLIGASATQTAKLDRLIGQAAQTGAGAGIAHGGALALPRPSMRRPLAALVAPLPGEGFALGPLRPAAVVFVSDPESSPRSPPEILSALYGLTAAEARLAWLVVTCDSLSAAAEQLGISIATARTHLRSIFNKTGARRQAELVALILRSPAGLD